jgi:CO/xanthine dehydrogenase Mo-binding subunit
VYVHRTQAGGGFGRRLAQDYTSQGVLIAKALNGVPVNLIWTRDEDLQHDQYRPASLVRLKAGLDEAGNPVALQCRVAAPALKDVDATAALADQPYSIANLRVEHAVRSSAVPVGYWRGAAHSQNPFVRECFIDELAHAAKRDPLDYRLALLPENSKERPSSRRPPRRSAGERRAAGPASRDRRDRGARQLYRRGGRACAAREEDRAEAAGGRARPSAGCQPRQRRRPGPGRRRLRAERAPLGRDYASRTGASSSRASATTAC